MTIAPHTKSDAPRVEEAINLAPHPGDPARDLRLRTARREITERRRITQRLRQALSSDGFVLHYQPQITLSTGAPRGGEAMIRLAHNRRGLILPSHFMPVAERSDIINDVGGWMLSHACNEASHWPEGFTLALTLSLRHLQSGRLMVKQLMEALNRSQIPAARLELELSEAMLIDESDDTVFSLRALRGLGVGLALNNFGLGYASLSALKRLPLNTLKLDRTLIQNMVEEESGTAIVHAAIEAGHALGCAILADGVETRQQCSALQDMGCEMGQGSYFCTPLPAEDLPAGFRK
jgi:EAL domain-containing protein (putative c-di-GMP-specific phosphodiesterase class I)